MAKNEVAIVGNEGVVGTAYSLMFPEAVMYDPSAIERQYPAESYEASIELGRKAVNECDIALVAVPTDLNPETGELDMTHVEDVVSWLETDLILFKSALQPGTVDRLEAETGKNIAVSVEFIGEGNYQVPYWKHPHQKDPRLHSMLIVGGRDEVATRSANYLWAKMSPDIEIHIVSAVEAEITKMMENTWGAMKVTFANAVYDICQKYGANYTKVLQAWGADGRVEKMHMRTMEGKRGWSSKCYDKDIPAFAKLDSSGFLGAIVTANEIHRGNNGPQNLDR